MTPRAFFFHYNKPASRAAKRPQISVHTGGHCYIVDNVDCQVPCYGRIKKRQPFFVMAGRGFCSLTIDAKGQYATITHRAPSTAL